MVCDNKAELRWSSFCRDTESSHLESWLNDTPSRSVYNRSVHLDLKLTVVHCAVLSNLVIRDSIYPCAIMESLRRCCRPMMHRSSRCRLSSFRRKLLEHSERKLCNWVQIYANQRIFPRICCIGYQMQRCVSSRRHSHGSQEDKTVQSHENPRNQYKCCLPSLLEMPVPWCIARRKLYEPLFDMVYNIYKLLSQEEIVSWYPEEH